MVVDLGCGDQGSVQDHVSRNTEKYSSSPCDGGSEVMPLGVEFCRALKRAGFGETIIEVGSKPASEQETLANLRPIFNAKRYVGVDIEPGFNVDMVCSGTHLREHFNHKEFELGICIDTLEHCWDPGSVVVNLAYVARNVALRAPFAAPIHRHPWDFWRFTPETITRWLKTRFSSGLTAVDPALVDYPGEWPHGVYGFGGDSVSRRDAVVRELQGRPERDITIVEVW